MTPADTPRGSAGPRKPKLRQWFDDECQWRYIEVEPDDVRLLNCQQARDAVTDLRAKLAKTERERDEQRFLVSDYLNTPVGQHIARADAAEAALRKVTEALGWFCGADDRFQVAVGGNPRAVDKMIAEAQARYSAALTPPAETIVKG